jgi:hypothetical protein
MSRARTFKKADVTRALQAAEDAGHRVSHYEIDKAGKIVVILAAEQTHAIEQDNSESEWRLP